MNALEGYLGWIRTRHWPTTESLVTFSVIFAIIFLSRNALRSSEERPGLVCSVVLSALCSFEGAQVARDFAFIAALVCGLLSFSICTRVFFSRGTRKEIYFRGGLLLPFLVALIQLGAPLRAAQVLHAAIALSIGLLSFAIYKRRPGRNFFAPLQIRVSPLNFFLFADPLARTLADGSWAQPRLEHAVMVAALFAVSLSTLVHKKTQLFLIKT